MDYFIWHNPQTEQYNHGTQWDYDQQQSVSPDHLLTRLYEFEKAEKQRIEKVVTRLNAARKEAMTVLG